MTRIELPGLIIEKEKAIATLTLNRPDRLNALDAVLLRESLPNGIDDVTKDDDIRVVILTGAGRSFCAGADVNEIKGMPSPRWVRLMPLGWVALAFQKCNKPIIAAINGPAVGGGLSLTLLCDFRIASEQATFSMLFVNMGLIPDGGSTYNLPRIVGLSKALQLVLTGDKIDAAEAKRVGLVDEVVPANKLMDTTTELASRITRGAPIAVELAKRSLYNGLYNTLEQQLYVEGDAQRLCARSSDHKEAIKAYLEKRDPVFKGL